VFSPVVLQMVAVGEETGEIDELMAEIADMYEREVGIEVEGLTAKLEPILLVFMGVLVLILALGVFLPMWDLATVARGGIGCEMKARVFAARAAHRHRHPQRAAGGGDRQAAGVALRGRAQRGADGDRRAAQRALHRIRRPPAARGELKRMDGARGRQPDELPVGEARWLCRASSTARTPRCSSRGPGISTCATGRWST
jgi:hypothetical protein